MERSMRLFVRDSADSILAAQNNDPNVGSARGTSTDAFLTTLAVNSLIFVVILFLFLFFRRQNRRIYAPLTCVASIESWRKLKYSNKSTKWGIVDTIEGYPGFSKRFGWIWNVWKLPDETVLRTNGLDGYLFLRYIRQSMFICGLGILFTFMLLPVNATGGGGQSGLDLLSFSNLGMSSNKRLYAHVIISYLYFGFVLFIIYRELLFYVAIRQAYMHSDLYSSRLSARVLIITSIPERYRSVEALRAVFGPSVEHVWMNRQNRKLERLVKRRYNVAMMLEEAEVKLIRRLDKQRRRANRRNTPIPTESNEPRTFIQRWLYNGNCVFRWINNSYKRPTRWALGQKVDTITWCRARLETLNREVAQLQELTRTGEAGKMCNSAFVAFTSQFEAQKALRIVIHDLTIQMAPREIGVSPGEVVWENLNVGFWERNVRTLAATAIFAFMTLFWSIPNAFVGTISQLSYLAEKLPFLHFIYDLPGFVVGAITGLLPPLLLSWLLDFVPTILQWLLLISGETNYPSIQLKLQNWYFIFLVIQVFLVTTITSAASAAAAQIIKNPTSVANLLAENLPKASNFYISYMLLQGLSISSGIVLQFFELIFFKVLGLFFDNTPRKRWTRWANLVDPGIGSIFPFYTNFTVIALTYSLIAPTVLLFATPGLGLVYFAYRYNFLFVYSTRVCTKGLAYPRAWQQTLTGVYLCQGCMIGLFALKKQIGPIILQLVLIACTVAFQHSLMANISTLLSHLPDVPAPPRREAGSESCSQPTTDPEKGGPNFAQRTLSSLSKTAKISLSSEHPEPGNVQGVAMRLLRPELYLDHRVLEKLVPKLELQDRLKAPQSSEEYDYAYHHPSVIVEPPVIWVPQDAAGAYAVALKETARVNPIDHAGLVLDPDNGKFVLREDKDLPPDWEAEELWAV
ncbi:hypothetical protein FN846DRAFT_907594 [Sphaerosporella brunnea]|uniref:DUF221 domain protein n=1 Tax=Sphaerosporella brunnea TaxID=1250544 RepID=A0A5J5EVP1_9PEZI|nr:hypothetical protein FN846DRAFT_907594 [Sphaerosporella brunnea]